MSTIAWISLENELCVDSGAEPFTLTSGGIVPANGMQYNMSVAKERQALYDDGLAFLINTVAAETHKIHSKTMVAFGAFSMHAVNRNYKTFVK